MSEQNDPREQADANTEQELELNDLAVQNEHADQIRGGEAAKTTPPPPPKSKGLFEVTDWGFDP